MDKVTKNTAKDEINRITFLKTELKKKIIKSLLHGKQISPILKVYLKLKIIFLKKTTFISRHLNVCLIRGRVGGVYKQYNLSRHAMIKLATSGSLQNTKIRSW